MMIEQGDSKFLNMKERLVYCPYCKHDRRTRELHPYCLECKKPMLTVLFSHLTGERITK